MSKASRKRAEVALDWFLAADPQNAQSLVELLDDGDGRFTSVHHLAAVLKDELSVLRFGIGSEARRGAVQVLLGFADEFSGEDGEGCDYEPSLASIAKASGLSVAEVRRVMDRLIQRRIITVCVWSDVGGQYSPGPDFDCIPVNWPEGSSFSVGVGDAPETAL